MTSLAAPRAGPGALALAVRCIAPFALACALGLPIAATAQVSFSITLAPPPLPYYAQPPLPGDGYLWAPGYWAWSQDDGAYYWVPGTWVMAPSPGDLWTPGYWAFASTAFIWHVGYWGPRVGYYGGLNYGHGYGGDGYQGGRWQRNVFIYNTQVNNVDRRVVRNVYSAPVARNGRGGGVSYNGGPQGSRVRPTAPQRQLEAATHVGPTPVQVQHEQAAIRTPTQRATRDPRNAGAPGVAATRNPSALGEPGAVPMPVPRAVPKAAPRPAAATPPNAREAAAPKLAPGVAREAPAPRLAPGTQRDQPAEAAPAPARGREPGNARTPAAPPREQAQAQKPAPAAAPREAPAPRAQPQETQRQQLQKQAPREQAQKQAPREQPQQEAPRQQPQKQAPREQPQAQPQREQPAQRAPQEQPRGQPDQGNRGNQKNDEPRSPQ